MTLGEGKRKVYMLLDEYSSGGTVTADSDIEAKMADLFDIAQKQVSEIKRLIKVYTVERESGTTEYSMPADFVSLRRVWRGGRITDRFDWIGRSIIIPEGETETVKIEYFAVPATIGPETTDEYVFELPDDAAKALPFFVASQQLIADLVMDYSALYQIYNSMLATMDTSLPGGKKFKNTFYRRA